MNIRKNEYKNDYKNEKTNVYKNKYTNQSRINYIYFYLKNKHYLNG